MRYGKWISILFLLCLQLPLHAQFTDSENDPASLRWMQVSSPNFRVIYPEGCDSLAKEYLSRLEYFRPKLAPSIGMVSGQFMRRPMDVVLHTRNAMSNGFVTWTPSRMEMNTVPQWDQGANLPWITKLSIHEGRHAAQMQLGYRRVFRPFRYILGQLVPGAVHVYPSSLLDEGDAVVAETAITDGGRGRESRFLDRYMYCLDNGDKRNYQRWRFGSYYLPTPNNYAFGYTVISAMRTKWDAPYFMAEYMDYVGRRPYNPFPLFTNVKRLTGKQKFLRSVDQMIDWHYQFWAQDTVLRQPFMPYTQLSKIPRSRTGYTDPNAVNDSLVVWTKASLYRLPSLVAMDADGKQKRLATMPSYHGKVSSDGSGKLFLWNEVRRDPRWGQVYNSVIRTYDMESGKVKTIRQDGNNFTPVFMTEDRIASVRNHQNGGSEILEMTYPEGEILCSHSVPSGLQIISLLYHGNAFYAAAIAEGGMGIWCLREGDWSEVLPAKPVTIEALKFNAGEITFESDHNGSWELYSYNPDSQKLTLITSTKYGGGNYEFLPGGDLVFSRMVKKGFSVMKTSKEDLAPRDVDWDNNYRYKIADMLSEQEDTMKFYQRLKHPVKVDMQVHDSLSAPKRYSKALHAVRVHSWAPLFVDQDAVESISSGNVLNIAALGATAFFQNSMSTLYGQASYKAEKNYRYDFDGMWFHSGHLKLTYKGLYPVFELSVDVNDKPASKYYTLPIDYAGKLLVERIVKEDEEKYRPFVDVSLRTYVPLQWGGGPWHYGLIPQASVVYMNEVMDGRHTFLFTAGVRGYAIQGTPVGCIYPHWGVGAELKWMDPYTLAYMYGYLPGIAAGQGLRLTAMAQFSTPLSTSAIYLGGVGSLLPRGCSKVPAGVHRSGYKFTADYAIPFYVGDWNIGTAFYCTRGIFTPHFDYSILNTTRAGSIFEREYPGGNLFSAGATFELEFASFFWVKTPIRIGVTASYNGGSLCPPKEVNPGARWFVGPTFSATIPN